MNILSLLQMYTVQSVENECGPPEPDRTGDDEHDRSGDDAGYLWLDGKRGTAIGQCSASSTLSFPGGK